MTEIKCSPTRPGFSGSVMSSTQVTYRQWLASLGNSLNLQSILGKMLEVGWREETILETRRW